MPSRELPCISQSGTRTTSQRIKIDNYHATHAATGCRCSSCSDSSTSGSTHLSCSCRHNGFAFKLYLHGKRVVPVVRIQCDYSRPFSSKLLNQLSYGRKMPDVLLTSRPKITLLCSTSKKHTITCSTVQLPADSRGQQNNPKIKLRHLCTQLDLAESIHSTAYICSGY